MNSWHFPYEYQSCSLLISCTKVIWWRLIWLKWSGVNHWSQWKEFMLTVHCPLFCFNWLIVAANHVSDFWRVCQRTMSLAGICWLVCKFFHLTLMAGERYHAWVDLHTHQPRASWDARVPHGTDTTSETYNSKIRVDWLTTPESGTGKYGINFHCENLLKSKTNT